MGKYRKPRVPKGGAPLPPMSRLKRLPEHDKETIFLWLYDKTQEEAALLIERNFSIAPGSPLSWPSLLSEWVSWENRQKDIAQANAISREMAEAYEAGSSKDPVALRNHQIKMVTLFLERCELSKRDPDLMLALAKEVRSGLEAQTRASQGAQKIAIADRRTKVAERKLDAVDRELRKLRDPGADDPAAREAILDEVDRIMGLKK